MRLSELLDCWNTGAGRRDFRQDFLDLGVSVPTKRFFFSDEVVTHATAGEILDALVVLSAVSMGVEVARIVVADIFKELYKEKSCFGVR